MKSISSAIIFLAGLVSASPVQQESSAGPYDITDFFASKGHLSAYCSYKFEVSAPELSTPAKCSAYVDAGSSSATWLAYVYEGIGKCDNQAVTWTFYQPSAAGSGATFNVTVDGVKGTYAVPASDITVSLNDPQNPYDNDVAYTGPREFKITTFP